MPFPSGLLLTESSAEELFQLKNWFTSAAALESWGGDGFYYPSLLPLFLQNLCRPASVAYSLLSNEQTQMLGFGQLCDRFGKHHLARLAIHPDHRGKGLSRVLICELLLKGLAAEQRDFSLYVNKQNHIALHCYQQLGFSFAPQPEEENEQLYFMLLTSEQALQQCQAYLNDYIEHIP